MASIATSVASGRSHVDSEVGAFSVYGSTGPIGRASKAEYSGQAILVARVGANAGTLNVVDGEYGVTDNTIIIRIGDSADFSYVWRQLEAKHLNSMVFGSGQPLITGTQLKNLSIPFPPTRAEQEAIAEALSDADALIESLEQVLTKKRQIKQGGMQELLTGQKRLPGFQAKPGYKQTEVGLIPQDWEVRTIRQFATIKTGPFGTLLKASEYSVYEGVPLISVGEVREGFFRITDETPRVSEDVCRRLPQYVLATGDVVFGRKGSVERSALVRNEQDGWFLGSDGISIRPSQGDAGEYLSYQFQSARVQSWLRQNAIGTTMPSLNQDVLGGVGIPFPPTHTEQTAIASVLSDMDSALSTLETKLSKARQLKQGMMQELLTGRTRLV
jgi:type I restriction enzyme S subunit